MRTLEERFWSRVDKTSDCWEWKGYIKNTGYGQFFFKGKQTGSHRVCWELIFGVIPDGVYVLHHCDNRTCVRPDHLWLGTQADNLADMVEKGRSAYGETNGNSKLVADEVITIRGLSAKGKTGRSLARLFGISESMISKIILQKHWVLTGG